MRPVLLRGGLVVDGTGREPFRADVEVRAGRIEAVVEPIAVADVDLPEPAAEPDADVVDCAGRLVLPGFVDTHSHADAAVFDAEVQCALLRQGVTTVVIGQDGISYAPGDGAYATEYFGPLLGAHPTYGGGGVAELLGSYDGRVPVNVAYLVPHGTVRDLVMSSADRQPSPAEVDAMAALVAEGMSAGACGLSTGLDYVPGGFASTAEIAELCRPVAAAGGIYVTHMRGGYEQNSRAGVDEVVEICRASSVRGHISHYHGPGELLIDLLTEAAAGGADLTFDAYPYRAGCTLLSMPALPPELLALDTDSIVAALRDDDKRKGLRDGWLASLADEPAFGPTWTDRAIISAVGAEEFAWSAGRTISQAADEAGTDPSSFVLDLLASSRLAVSAVMPLPPGRTVDELAALIRHDRHMIGSDGIYVGQHPHPRGWGSFARVLARHVRDRGDLSWAAAATHLSSTPAQRFGLAGRGQIQPGWQADLVVVDPGKVQDRATYDSPRALAEGIDDVLVRGVRVLADGALTGALPAGGLPAG